MQQVALTCYTPRQEIWVDGSLRDAGRARDSEQQGATTMKTRTIVSAVGVLMILAVIAFVWPLRAQQTAGSNYMSRHGYQVEELHVGTSCVVVVSITGAGPNSVAAVPCSR